MKAILPICLLAASQLLAAVPTAINYQGRLTDGDGNPASGTKTFSLKIHDAPTGGNEIYTETIGSVVVDANGIYNFQFGANGSSVVATSEVIATTDGIGTNFYGTTSQMPLAGTLSVTGGIYSWNEVDGNPGAQSTASATVINGFVVGITVNDGGEAYTTPPTVTITGDGTGASATASVTNGAVSSISVDNPGSGYTTAMVTIEEPPAPFIVHYSEGALTFTYESASVLGTEIVASYQASENSITGALQEAGSHWIELIVDGQMQAPRERILTVPFALMSAGEGPLRSSIELNNILIKKALALALPASRTVMIDERPDARISGTSQIVLNGMYVRQARSAKGITQFAQRLFARFEYVDGTSVTLEDDYNGTNSTSENFINPNLAKKVQRVVFSSYANLSSVLVLRNVNINANLSGYTVNKPYNLRVEHRDGYDVVIKAKDATGLTIATFINEEYQLNELPVPVSIHELTLNYVAKPPSSSADLLDPPELVLTEFPF